MIKSMYKDNKETKIQIRAKKEEKAKLQAEAKRRGISMSKLICEYIDSLVAA